VDNPTIASEAQFRICPLCEETRLVFSGLNEARCPVCDHEPSSHFLKALRQIVSLPIRVGTPNPKTELREGDEE
jgi:hypothetical protein